MIATFYLDLALIMLLLAVSGAVIALWRGPTLANRILVFEMLTGLAVALITVIAMRVDTSSYLDIALAMMLIGALATLALARYLSRRGEAPQRYGERNANITETQAHE